MKIEFTSKGCLILILILFVGKATCQFHESRVIIKISDKEAIFENETSFEFVYNPLLERLNNEFLLSDIHCLNPNQNQDIFTLSFNKEGLIDNIIREYGKLGMFEYIERDYIGYGGGMSLGPLKPNDEFYNRQWSHYNDGSFALTNSKPGADVKIEDAWDVTQGSQDIVVAILDSGVNFNHPEFSNRFWENEGESASGEDLDSNGYAADYRGWDFVNNDNNAVDDHGHGTNVAGILGANGNNGQGYAGADWNAKLMILKILDETNSGYYSWWVEAIYYAIDNGADVLNMSVGGSGFSATMKDAIETAHDNNIAVIVCMMNENNEIPFYPAAYSASIAIGSTNPDDSRSDAFPWDISKGSNYGDHIDLIAPGNYIFGLSYNNNTNYGTYWAGTSQATPLVTGTVSLMLSQEPNLTPEQIRYILTTTADDEVGKSWEDVPGWDKYHGAGRLNAAGALNNLNPSSVTSEDFKQFKIIGIPALKSNGFLLSFNDSEPKEIKIYNSAGKTLLQTKTQNQVLKIHTHDFEKGLYFVQVRQKHKKYSTRKIIIN